MSEKLAIEVKGVGVSYKVYPDLPQGFKSRFSSKKISRESLMIQAIDDVSFDLKLGETLGIIGANGSGKSSMLMALTGLLPINSGSIKVRSRPVLLSVNSALRPALSGRRNIIIGGLAMGMSKKEIELKVNEISAFADLGRAIDLPMRTYSSGMRARLAFAIATSKFPEILLIDEALAVGDESFKQRSAERIKEIRGKAGSVILVSHNMDEVLRSCQRALWLDNGNLVGYGPVEQIVQQYLDFSHRS